MDRITDFLSMGGYAEFVWPAFAVTIVVMTALVIVSRRSLQADRRTLDSLESVRESRRKGRKGAQGPDKGGTDSEA
jgi:heme exporter protein D